MKTDNPTEPAAEKAFGKFTQLPSTEQAMARIEIRGELMLESSEVTAKMIEDRAAEFEWAVVPGAKPERRPMPKAEAPIAAAPKAAAASTVAAPATAVKTDAQEDRVQRIALAQLRQSPFNPRGLLTNAESEQLKKAGELLTTGKLDEAARPMFSPRVEALIDMAKTMLPPRGGILQPLIVRPTATGMEIVAGHRRWYGARIAGLTTVPVIVRQVPDDVIVEQMLIENLQREDLNPIEEARGVESLLQLTGATGEKLWSVAGIAAKIGRTEKHVSNTRRILRVPARFHAKIEDGTLARAICYLIAAIPDGKLREKAAAEIVKGDYSGPFTWRSAKLHIARNYMTELRGAPFDPKDAELLPVKKEAGERVCGGACADCPLNSVVRKDEDVAEADHVARCMNPACFQAKVDAHVKCALRKAEAAGDKVVTGAAAEKLLGWDGDLLSGSGKVKLNEKPTGEIIGTKKAPKWEKMLDGEVKPEITTVIDKKGRAIRVVDRSNAIECAKQNGFKDLFVAGAEKQKGAILTADEKKMKERRAKELAAEKLTSATTAAWMDALVNDLAARGAMPEKGLPFLLDLAIGHAGSDGRKWVINRRGLTMLKHKHKWGEQPDAEKTITEHAKSLQPPAVSALIVELMLAQGLRWNPGGTEEFRGLLTVCNLPLADIEQKVKEELAAKKQGKAGDEEPVREKILRMGKARKLSPDGLNKVASRVLGKPFSEKPFDNARGPELAAILEEMQALSNLDPAAGWIAEGDKIKCPRCGAVEPGLGDKSVFTRVGCAPVCGYNGTVPKAKKEKAVAPAKSAKKPGKKKRG